MDSVQPSSASQRIPRNLSGVTSTGWKLHLNFDSSNEDVVRAVTHALMKLRDQGVINRFKVGAGGGIDAGHLGKEATVVVGSLQSAQRAAELIENEIGAILLPMDPAFINHQSAKLGSKFKASRDPDKCFDIDALIDDIPLYGDRIWARFDVWPHPGFSEYGVDGIPLKASIHRSLVSMAQWGTPEEKAKARSHETRSQAAAESLDQLSHEFGKHFSGEHEDPRDWYRSRVELKHQMIASMARELNPDLIESQLRLTHNAAKTYLQRFSRGVSLS